MRSLLLGGVCLLGLAASVYGQQPASPPAAAGGGAVAWPAETKIPRFPREPKRYELGPDSQRREGVPKGHIEKFEWKTSKVFPDTVRDCAVYIPAQYDGSKPAALMVFQDGVSTYLAEDKDYRVPIVLDNLIHSGETPITIAVFIQPGTRGAANEGNGKAPARTSNRSFEYDTLSPAYSEFLLTEILPHVEQTYKVRFSTDPNLRAICGQSSGGICAFTVAWERPDQFHKVVSNVGSFTDIRGGHKYPEMIAAVEAKPLRVFLQDGDSDNRYRQENRNWVAANHKMAAVLEEKEYDYKYVLGEGAHNGNHGGSIFPDAMRWLWRDHKNQP